MSEEVKRIIPGCEHDRIRMTVWANEGACPICLTAEVGMLREENAALRQQVAELQKEVVDGNNSYWPDMYKELEDEVAELRAENERLTKVHDMFDQVSSLNAELERRIAKMDAALAAIQDSQANYLTHDDIERIASEARQT